MRTIEGALFFAVIQYVIPCNITARDALKMKNNTMTRGKY